jgi:hypothetical protein
MWPASGQCMAGGSGCTSEMKRVETHGMRLRVYEASRDAWHASTSE